MLHSIPEGLLTPHRQLLESHREAAGRKTVLWTHPINSSLHLTHSKQSTEKIISTVLKEQRKRQEKDLVVHLFGKCPPTKIRNETIRNPIFYWRENLWTTKLGCSLIFFVLVNKQQTLHGCHSHQILFVLDLILNIHYAPILQTSQNNEKIFHESLKESEIWSSKSTKSYYKRNHQHQGLIQEHHIKHIHYNVCAHEAD